MAIASGLILCALLGYAMAGGYTLLCDGQYMEHDDPDKYWQVSQTDLHEKQCPANLVFDPNTCICNHWIGFPTMPNPNGPVLPFPPTGTVAPPVCEPRLHIDFTGSVVEDKSPANSWIYNNGVTVANGVGQFDGSNSLMVYSLSGADFQGEIHVRITYSQTSTGGMQTLFTNSNVSPLQQSPASIMMCSNSSHVISALNTYSPTNGQSVLSAQRTAVSPDEETVYLDYQDNSNSLHAESNMDTQTMVLNGHIQRRSSPFLIGAGQCGGFTGTISEIEIYQDCVPTNWGPA